MFYTYIAPWLTARGRESRPRTSAASCSPTARRCRRPGARRRGRRPVPAGSAAPAADRAIVIAVAGLAVLGPGAPVRIVVGMAIWGRCLRRHPVAAPGPDAALGVRPAARHRVGLADDLVQHRDRRRGAARRCCCSTASGFGVLPWATAAFVVVAIVFILATDRRAGELCIPANIGADARHGRHDTVIA